MIDKMGNTVVSKCNIRVFMNPLYLNTFHRGKVVEEYFHPLKRQVLISVAHSSGEEGRQQCQPTLGMGHNLLASFQMLTSSLATQETKTLNSEPKRYLSFQPVFIKTRHVTM